MPTFRCIALAGVVAIAGAADWPQWRGPQRDGHSTETGLLPQWPAEGPKLVWQINDIGDGYSTPAVVGQRLYVLTNQGIDDELVHCYSTTDGDELWKTRIGKVGNPDQQPPFAACRSTPTVDGDAVYAFGSDGDLVCLDATSGEIRWQRNVRTEFGGEPGTWAYAESPLVDGEVVVCCPGGFDATVVALDKRTGEVVWTCPVPAGDAAGYASAIVVEAAGRKQYVQFMAGGVVGIDAESGTFLWRYDGTGRGPANSPTPVAHDRFVYSAAGRTGGGLVEIKANGQDLIAEEVYKSRGVPHGMGGSVLVDDLLFGTTRDALVCAEFATGDVLWEAESIAPGSVCYADGRLYVHGDENDLALVEPDAEEYRERGRFTLPDQPKHPRGRMERAWAYPLVANGRLYIRDAGTIWCYDIAAD